MHVNTKHSNWASITSTCWIKYRSRWFVGVNRIGMLLWHIFTFCHRVCLCELLLIICSCRLHDEWSLSALNCLEHFASGSALLKVVPSCGSGMLSDVDKVRTFQHLVDCCNELASSHGPLWPACYSALLVELYRMLVTTDGEMLLHAMQLTVILLPRNASSHLRCLLLFMNCMASSTEVSLSAKANDQTVL